MVSRMALAFMPPPLSESTSSPMPLRAPAPAARGNASSRERLPLGGALNFDDPARAGHHEIGIGRGGRILDIVEIEHRLAAMDAARYRRDMILERVALRTSPASHPREASWSATQSPVIAAVRVPPSAWMTSQSRVICRSPERDEVDHRAQRPADQPLDFLGAA